MAPAEPISTGFGTIRMVGRFWLLRSHAHAGTQSGALQRGFVVWVCPLLCASIYGTRVNRGGLGLPSQSEKSHR
jgi:hypothetical protein